MYKILSIPCFFPPKNINSLVGMGMGNMFVGQGYCFMDSPGNDLESMAGQVGSGCNVLMFTTGNGAITNFPFVPTIKVVTTTKRFNLLSKDLDLNAGQFQDGSQSMAELGKSGYAYLLAIASGLRSSGEKNGNHQVP